MAERHIKFDPDTQRKRINLLRAVIHEVPSGLHEDAGLRVLEAMEKELQIEENLTYAQDEIDRCAKPIRYALAVIFSAFLVWAWFPLSGAAALQAWVGVFALMYIPEIAEYTAIVYTLWRDGELWKERD